MEAEHLLPPFSKTDFCRAIREQGFYIVRNLISSETIQQLTSATENAIRSEAAYHGTTDYRDYGVVQACPMYGGAFIDLLDHRELMEPFNWVMGEGSMLYVYISSCMPPHAPNFSSRMHVDRPRLFPNYTECLAALVLLTDFTEENGATWFLPASHHQENPPDESFFYQNAQRLIAPAGSVMYFNLRLWHAGGMNQTDRWRHALALGVVRPYLKQKFDLPGMIRHQGIDESSISDYAKQKLGYFAIPPKSLDEFYGPPEKRTYREISEWQIAELERKNRS